MLATNKNESNNEFINALNQFKIDGDIDKTLGKLTDIKEKTKDETLQKYIENLISLDKAKLSFFFQKLQLKQVLMK